MAFSIDKLVSDARSIASTGHTVEAKVASDRPEATDIGNSIRGVAAELRAIDQDEIMRDGFYSALQGKIAFENIGAEVKVSSLDVELELLPGQSQQEVLRNVAGAIRDVAHETKVAAEQRGFEVFRGHAALASVDLLLS